MTYNNIKKYVCIGLVALAIALCAAFAVPETAEPEISMCDEGYVWLLQ